ncbi:glycosyl hydrolase family 18 protein [Gaetbulibacter sp. M235]|uniref:glycosyl hydrolase family 18 protein n=1 Tax=Gaetbulibacter sp. M235 TaxID=3126510 RepID=UPI00374EDEAC
MQVSAQQDYYLDFASSNKVTSNAAVIELNNTAKFTLEAEVFLDSQTNLTNVLSKIYDNNNRVALQISNGVIYGIVSNGANAYRCTSNAVLTTGLWYHIAMVYDGTLSTTTDRVKLFINGVQEINLVTSGAIPSLTSNDTNFTSKPYVVGGTYFDGRIDDVRVWNTALSANTINIWKNIHLETNHPNYANLKLYWDFDNISNSSVVSAANGTLYAGTIEAATYGGPTVHEHVVGGYLPSYRLTSFALKNPSLAMEHLTHLYYFSISTDVSGNLGAVDSNGNFTPLANYLPSVQSNLNTIKSWIGTKKTKLILVFGGWVSSDYIDEVAASPTARNNVAQNLVDFCINNQLDGIDIDWENYHGEVNDVNYVNLVSAIKSKILASSNTDLELSVTILPEHDKPNDPIGLNGLFGNIDFLQIMSYGKSRISQGTQIPMSKVQEYYTRWTNAGLPSAKLVLGLPDYAKTLVDDSTLFYSDLVAQNPNLDPNLDAVVSSGKTYYFNGVNTIKEKAQYVLDNNLKGVMFWELYQDTDITNSISLLKAATSIIPVNVTSTPLSNNNFEIDNELKVYPNPSTNLFNVSFYSNNPRFTKILVYDINSRLVWENINSLNTGLNNIALDLKKLNTGFYILRVIDGDKTSTKKLIKNE